MTVKIPINTNINGSTDIILDIKIPLIIYKNSKIKATKEFIIVRFPCTKDKLSLKNNCTAKTIRDITNKNGISFKTFFFLKNLEYCYQNLCSL
ncbi:hypothetical protein KST03_05860 [Fusobacterium animalis]